MNFNNIVKEIEKIDPEIYERTSARRDVFKNFGGFGKKIALTALPFAIGSIFQKAYGQTPASVVEVLNFALTLEYLESSFYAKAVNTSGLIAAADAGGFATINSHEAEHVAFLTAAITASGGTPVAKPAFDFTAKGTFTDVFTNYATFLAVSQTFEDTGVRAYKGQAPSLQSNASVLTAALNIHSVEARHASYVRYVRYKTGVAVTPWITGIDSGGIGAAVAANYAGEDNTLQATVQIKNINGFNISADAASAAFDEPLTSAAVLTLVTPFFA